MGMGHLSPHAPLLEALSARGHDITVVSRDVARAKRAFGKMGCSILQAPVDLERPRPLYPLTVTLAQVLHNSGWWSASGLLARAESWNSLLELIRPDLVLSDFAPTLLLALRGRGIPHASLSTGFFVPPQTASLPRYWSFQQRLPDGVPHDETETLHLVNQVLEGLSGKPVKSLIELFHEGTLALLKTVPELDHFPKRESGHYLGPPPSPRGGLSPSWPAGKGPRIFAYLKPSPGLPTALQQLKQSGFRTLVVGDGITPELQKQFASPSLCFVPERLDLWEVARSCDVAINNANHGTTVHLLLAGKPVLSLPIYLEQQLIAGAVNQIGAGLAVSAQTARATKDALARLIDESSFRNAAMSFAARNQHYSMDGYLERALSELATIASI